MTRFVPDRPTVALLLVLLALPAAALALPAAALAQTATVAVDRENLRAVARGTVIAELDQGTRLTLGNRWERWREATLVAWIWAPSVETDDVQAYDLKVSAPDGENLRASPNGRRLGRARPGMRLEEVERRDDWVRVRRTGWIWEPSLRLPGQAGADPAETEPRPDASAADSATARAVQATADTTAAPPPAARGGEREFVALGARALVVLGAPGGDTLARVQPRGTVEVLAREGDWTRVRVEGWALSGALTADTLGGGVLRDITVAELQEEPERVRGRMVEWTVQFIALQHAERFRTDFLEGEPFILARGPGDDAGFVYVAVPPEREAEVAALSALQRVRVVGTVRTARSRLTDAPVIDLLRIAPIR